MRRGAAATAFIRCLAQRFTARALLQRGLLAVLSVAICLAACEAALRLLQPRYQFAASPRAPIRSEVSPTYFRDRHPDTKVEHLVIHNNLGGRQSRSFSPASLQGAVNIAFFGDSQTENIHMPAPYSYTEPLDYLLNAHPDAAAKASAPPFPNLANAFNVLNLGVGGYGTGRSWLRWRHLPVRGELKHVFYMVWENDLFDLSQSIRLGIVQVDESGEVLEGSAPRPPPWKRLLARLHLTYLAIDAWRRLVPSPVAPATPVDDFGTMEAARYGSDGKKGTNVPTVRVFRKLLRRWKREVEADGGAFHVVLLPSSFAVDWIRNDAKLRDDLKVLDLRVCFEAADPPFEYDKWRFAKDYHWNPEANMVAASCLYRYLEGVLDLPARPNEALAATRNAYFRAFLGSPAWKGERYVPDAARATGEQGARNGSEIVAKYLALELVPAMNDGWLEAVSAARAAGALATSTWSVYATSRRFAGTARPPTGQQVRDGDRPRRLLVYVKRPCPANFRPAGHFFLHVVPFAPEHLAAAGGATGPAYFINLDAGPFSPLYRRADECVFSVPLPNYPLSTLRTGRYTTEGEGVFRELWSVRFQMRLAQSVWDIHASANGRGLDYVKKPCRETDTQGRFFLRVHPLRPTDTRRGFAKLDFDWSGKGVMAEGGCRISAVLPPYPIAFVDTGQFADGIVSKRLWSVRIDLAEEERLFGDGAASP